MSGLSEALRRLLVLTVAGPCVLLVGSIWFLVAFPIGGLTYLMQPNKDWWLWPYTWSFATWPFIGFYCLLTGYKPPEKEFWR